MPKSTNNFVLLILGPLLCLGACSNNTSQAPSGTSVSRACVDAFRNQAISAFQESIPVSPASDLRTDLGFVDGDIGEALAALELRFSVKLSTPTQYVTVQDVIDAVNNARNATTPP